MAAVLLCTDEPILGEGLRRILDNVSGLELVDYCGLADLHRQIAIIQPDILFVTMTPEVTFPVLSGLRELIPASSSIVLWVHSISTDLATQSMSLGIRGILRRTLPAETLVRCLLRVSEGESWFDKALTDSIMTARNYSLTRREGQLVTLLTQGLKNKEIATQMKITEGTVKVYMSRLLRKLEVKDRFELALYGLKNLAPASDVCALAAAARPFLVERMPAGSDRAPERKLSRLPC